MSWVLVLVGLGAALATGVLELGGPAKDAVEVVAGVAVAGAGGSEELLALLVAAAVGLLGLVLALRYFWSGKEPPFMAPPDGGVAVGRDFKVVGNKKSVQLADIPTLVSEMRASFDCGLPLPMWKRVEQLRALQRMMVDNEGAIREAIQRDLGRPWGETMVYDFMIPVREIDHTIANLRRWTARRYVSDIALLTFPSTQWLQPEPYGVALVIGTWNFPFMLSIIPLMGAIAAGNTVVVKPCNVSQATAKLQAELIGRYLDPRVVSVVGADIPGDRHTTAALLKEKFDVVFFTGSPAVGKIVALGAAQHLAKCILELGGKNPVLVAADADVDKAAKTTVWGRLMNGGQQCVSPDYVLCDRRVAGEFAAAAAKYCKQLYPDPRTPLNLGRIVGDSQMLRLKGLLDSHGGELVCGGEYDVASRYIAPTVVKVDEGSSLMQDEIFGPILPVVEVDDMAAALKIVRARPKPLSMYLFSRSSAVQDQVLANSSAGGVTINGTLFHAGHPGLPFGGVGESGLGAYHGKATIECFQHLKPCLKRTALWDFGLLSDPFFVYPPWSSLKVFLFRKILSMS